MEVSASFLLPIASELFQVQVSATFVRVQRSQNMSFSASFVEKKRGTGDTQLEPYQGQVWNGLCALWQMISHWRIDVLYCCTRLGAKGRGKEVLGGKGISAVNYRYYEGGCLMSLWKSGIFMLARYKGIGEKYAKNQLHLICFACKSLLFCVIWLSL